VTPALVWALLGASLVAGLAAVIRMAGPAEGGFDDVAGIIRLPELVTGTVFALFALAAGVFIVDLVRRARSRRLEDEGEAAEERRLPAWMRALNQVASLLYFTLVAYLLWRGAGPVVDIMAGRGAGGIGSALPQNMPSAPPLVTWTFGILALAAGLGALAFAVWFALSDRIAAWWEGDTAEPPAPALAEAVEESLGDLRSETDARRAIIRCYARFERAAAASGLTRQPWLTPMEFMREALGRLAAPASAVRTLTGLFELARFSHRELGLPERDRALDALDEIRASIEARHADVVAG
jgi:Domain of unknown function (DUF4129)